METTFKQGGFEPKNDNQPTCMNDPMPPGVMFLEMMFPEERFSEEMFLEERLMVGSFPRGEFLVTAKGSTVLIKLMVGAASNNKTTTSLCKRKKEKQKQQLT